MSILSLRYPVYALDFHMLLPAGTILTEAVMDTLIASNRDASYISCPLLEYSSIKDDLVRFLDSAPFNVIFGEKETIDELFHTMKDISMISPFIESLDYFKHYNYDTYRHMLVVYALSVLMAKDLFHDYKDRLRSISTGHIHDIGKMWIPPSILDKPTPLTKEERDIIMHHTISGYVLSCYYLRNSGDVAGLITRDHHERLDGSGHPQGITIEDNMVIIVAVCDIYDALVSSRPYRRAAYDNRSALEEISAMAERNQISWDVVKALVARNRKNKPDYRETEVSLEKRGAPPWGNVYGKVAPEISKHDTPSKRKLNNRYFPYLEQ